MIDGTVNEYLDEVVHLRNMRVDEPLHIPTADEYFEETGRVILSSGGPDEPFSLRDGPPPAILGSFVWSGYGPDGLMNINVDSYFSNVQISGNCPYTAWRIRGLFRTGYTQGFQTTPPATPVYGLSGVLPSHGTFQAITGGWTLNPGISGSQFDNNSLFRWPTAVFFRYGANGYSPDLWFSIGMQIEVGYAGYTYDPLNLEATRYWPAFHAPIKTDYPQYRGWDTTWACVNGYANAPHVPDTCGYRGQGGYVAPPEPEDE